MERPSVKQMFMGVIGHLISIIIVGAIALFIWNFGAHSLLPNQVPSINILNALAIGLFLYFIHVVVGIYQTRLFFQKLEKASQMESLRLDADIRYKLMEKELEAIMKSNLEVTPQQVVEVHE